MVGANGGVIVVTVLESVGSADERDRDKSSDFVSPMMTRRVKHLYWTVPAGAFRSVYTALPLDGTTPVAAVVVSTVHVAPPSVDRRNVTHEADELDTSAVIVTVLPLVLTAVTLRGAAGVVEMIAVSTCALSPP